MAVQFSKTVRVFCILRDQDGHSVIYDGNYIYDAAANLFYEWRSRGLTKFYVSAMVHGIEQVDGVVVGRAKHAPTIQFWERTAGADFLPYMTEIPLNLDNLTNALTGKSFEQNGMKFYFSEEVHSNGHWATNSTGTCKVYIDLYNTTEI